MSKEQVKKITDILDGNHQNYDDPELEAYVRSIGQWGEIEEDVKDPFNNSINDLTEDEKKDLYRSYISEDATPSELANEYLLTRQNVGEVVHQMQHPDKEIFHVAQVEQLKEMVRSGTTSVERIARETELPIRYVSLWLTKWKAFINEHHNYRA